MMRHRIIGGVAVTAAATFALLAAPRSARADDWRKTYNISSHADVHIDTNDGAVRIMTAAGGKTVDAHVETEGWRIADNEVRVVEHQTGDRLDLEVRVPSGHWDFGWGRHRALRIILTMPREADLTVRTGDGSVESQAISGNVDIHTGDGHITVNGMKGETRLSTGDGHIDANDVEGRLDANSGDGHINVDGRFDVLNVRTNDGSIEVRVASGSKMASSWSFRSGDGHVTLRLPSDFKADLDAHTGDGRISMDFPITVSGSIGKDVHGQLNGGGPSLSVHTGDGSIRIERQ